MDRGALDPWALSRAGAPGPESPAAPTPTQQHLREGCCLTASKAPPKRGQRGGQKFPG